MADDVTTQSTTPATVPAGGVYAFDLIGGVYYQRCKVSLGADGSAADAPGDGTNGMDVDVTRVIPGTSATHLGKAEDAAHSSGDTGVMALGVRQDTAAALATTDGDYAPFEVDANGRVHVVNSAGVGGPVAHDAADSGNPIGVGLNARTTNPTAVADGDKVRSIGDKIGRIVAVLNQVRDLVGSQVTTITNSTSETTIVTAVASTFCDLTHLTLTNASATAVVATLKDATGGTTRGIYALAANGGIVLTFPTPKKQATVNNNWTITLSGNTVTVYIVAEFVQNI